MKNIEKKYQIFISSTYEDLKEERRKVQDIILEMYHFPIGMEMFSAANEEQWEIIQETIDNSDYYVLIMGHRYGSVIQDGEYAGISYTQKEFRYALKKKIPILAFLIDNNVPVTPDKIEENEEKKKKLVDFKKEVTTGRIVEWWTSKEDLASKVMNALNKQIIKGKRPGWVRADALNFKELFTADDLKVTIQMQNVDSIENICCELLKELDNVLVNIERNIEYRKYYLDYLKVEYKGVNSIINSLIKDKSEETKRMLYENIWKNVFIDNKEDIDFRYIYILINLINEQKIKADVSNDMQKIDIPTIDNFLPYESAYWKSSMEAMFYLLEQCPKIYDMFEEGVKAKLKIAVEKNLRYIVRAYYLFDTVEEHINELEQIKREKIYSKGTALYPYTSAIWSSNDLIFLYERQKDESGKLKIKDFIMTLFRTCSSYDMSSELWEVIKYLLIKDSSVTIKVLDCIDNNSQIYRNRDCKQFLKDILNLTNITFDLNAYPTIKEIYAENSSDYK